MYRIRLQFITGLVFFILPVFFSKYIWSSPGLTLLAAGWFLFGGYLLYSYFLAPLERFSAILPEVKTAHFTEFIREAGAHLEELKNIARRAIQEKEEMASILFSMVEGVVATDSGGRISFMNPAAEKLFNLERGSALGKFPREVWREFELVELFHQVFVTGRSQSKELTLDPPLRKHLSLELVPIRPAEDEEAQGVLAMVRDITRLRHLENMRTEFVANVSHELRTPLTSIKGFIETLLDGGLENLEATKRFLTIIYQETDRLNRLINDLLDLSHLESGETELKRARIFLAPLVEEVRQTLQTRLAEKKLSFSVELGPTAVWADEDRIREVLVNLLDNAVKYTPDGGSIKVSEVDHGDMQEFIICDTGIGIPRESIPRLFERFYRVDKARSREMGGTGLGLSIVKHIIDRHEGKVWVQSEPGKGSCFHFTLPKFQQE
jgi:two-component system phosphate regulon sensor histidine kinase PhoR